MLEHLWDQYSHMHLCCLCSLVDWHRSRVYLASDLMQLSSWSLSFFSLWRLMGNYILVIISWTTSSISSSRSCFLCMFLCFARVHICRTHCCFMFYVWCFICHVAFMLCPMYLFFRMFCCFVSSQRVMLRCVWLPYMASCLSRCLIWKLPYLAVACCFACILMMRTHCLTWRMYCLPILGIMCLVA